MAPIIHPDLRQLFVTTCKSYLDDPIYLEKQWDLISKHYSASQRHYHTLAHLGHVSIQLIEVKPLIEDWDAVVFALFYHDYVYSIVRKDNEHKSALVAMKVLPGLNFPLDRCRRVMGHIEFTSGHEISPDSDTNYFTDADLSILGSDRKAYGEYSKNIRKEYWLYPDIIYNAGRRKVIERFLSMTKIFKTSHFQLLEKQARINLQEELLHLTN